MPFKCRFLRILLLLRNELDAFFPKYVKKLLGDIALVCKHAFCEMCHDFRITVIRISGGQTESQNFTAVINRQMEFKR